MIGDLFSNFFNFLATGAPDAQNKILEMTAHESAINYVQKSSKSELSSRFFGRLKLAEKTFIGEDFSETPLNLAYGKGRQCLRLNEGSFRREQKKNVNVKWRVTQLRSPRPMRLCPGRQRILL